MAIIHGYWSRSHGFADVGAHTNIEDDRLGPFDKIPSKLRGPIKFQMIISSGSSHCWGCFDSNPSSAHLSITTTYEAAFDQEAISIEMGMMPPGCNKAARLFERRER